MRSSRKLGDYDISQPRPISVHWPQQSMIMQQLNPLFSDHASINSINFQCYCGLWNRWSPVKNWGSRILVNPEPSQHIDLNNQQSCNNQLHYFSIMQQSTPLFSNVTVDCGIRWSWIGNWGTRILLLLSPKRCNALAGRSVLVRALLLLPTKFQLSSHGIGWGRGLSGYGYESIIVGGLYKSIRPTIVQWSGPIAKASLNWHPL